MKTILYKNQCTGCGNCLRFCPKQILKLSDQNDLNEKSLPYIQFENEEACMHCGACELMCTAGAIKVESKKQNGYTLIDKEAIPPHSGCYLGSLAKALSDVIVELKIQDKVVIFKKKASDVNLHVESHDYTDENFYLDGLNYKEENPDKIVIIICSSSKVHTTSLNEERYRLLKSEEVTIINTLNWFEANEEITTLSRGGSHILEEIGKESDASFVARGSVGTPKEMLQFENYLKQAIQYQMDGKRFSLIELVFPCFYRLSNRPQISMPCAALQNINEWFEKFVKPQYPEGIYKVGEENEFI